jgi:hypothetical protein
MVDDEAAKPGATSAPVIKAANRITSRLRAIAASPFVTAAASSAAFRRVGDMGGDRKASPPHHRHAP